MSETYLKHSQTCRINLLPKIVPEQKTAPELYSEPSQISKMELSAKIMNGWNPLTFFAKSSILEVPIQSE